jgi:undecaprenyl-diphosphatase
MRSAPTPPDHHRWNEPDGPDDDTFIGPRDLTIWDTAAGRVLVRLARRLWDLAYAVFGWAAPRWVLLSGLAVGLLVAALMAGGTAEVYESVVEGDGMAGLDRPVLETAVDLREPGLTTAVQFYTDLGAVPWMPVFATVVAVGLAWRWRSWTPLALMAVTGAGSLLMTMVGKAAVGRGRPPLADAVPPFESSFSFPSGHSLNSIALAGIVAYLLVRKLRRPWSRALAVVAASVVALLMGLSRVYLGHHWLTDVVVAWMLGIGWLALVITGHRLWLTLRRRGPRPVTGGAAPGQATP